MTVMASTINQATPAQLREHAAEATALLKGLVNEDRLMLLCQLFGGRYYVGQLEAATGITQPTLSQQLAVLREKGLVTTEKEGKYVFYRLADEKVVRIMRTLWDIYCAPDQDNGCTANQKAG